MKIYRVHLGDKRQLTIEADTYQQVGDNYVFFASGQPIPDVFVLASTVVGITVDPSTPQRVIPWTEGGSGYTGEVF